MRLKNWAHYTDLCAVTYFPLRAVKSQGWQKHGWQKLPPASCSVHVSGDPEAQRPRLDVAQPQQWILSRLLFSSHLLPKVLLLLSEVTGHCASNNWRYLHIEKEAKLSSRSPRGRPRKGTCHQQKRRRGNWGTPSGRLWAAQHPRFAGESWEPAGLPGWEQRAPRVPGHLGDTFKTTAGLLRPTLRVRRMYKACNLTVTRLKCLQDGIGKEMWGANAVAWCGCSLPLVG